MEVQTHHPQWPAGRNRHLDHGDLQHATLKIGSPGQGRYKTSRLRSRAALLFWMNSSAGIFDRRNYFTFCHPQFSEERCKGPHLLLFRPFMLSSSEFSCARSSASSMRGWALGGAPQAGRQRSAFPFLSAHRDAATPREVVDGVKYFLSVHAADYSRGCTLCRDFTDRLGAWV